jgi:hypothetical protein
LASNLAQGLKQLAMNLMEKKPKRSLSHFSLAIALPNYGEGRSHSADMISDRTVWLPISRKGWNNRQWIWWGRDRGDRFLILALRSHYPITARGDRTQQTRSAIAMFDFRSRARVEAIGNEFDGGEAEAIAW